MPAIFGLADNTPGLNTETRLRAMSTCMKHFPSYGEEVHVEPEVSVGLGRLRLDFQKASWPSDFPRGDAVVAVVDGEIYDADEQRSRLRAAGHSVHSDSL